MEKFFQKFDFFLMDYVFIPIHLLSEFHWTLVVVDIKQKKLTYYDSLNGKNPKCLKDIQEFFFEREKKYINMPNLSDHWKTDYATEIPRQTDSYNCGIFVLLYSLFIASNMEISFEIHELKHYRNLFLVHTLEKKI